MIVVPRDRVGGSAVDWLPGPVVSATSAAASRDHRDSRCCSIRVATRLNTACVELWSAGTLELVMRHINAMVLILLIVVTPLSAMASALDQPDCESMQTMALTTDSPDMGSHAGSSDMSDCCDAHDCASCSAPCAANPVVPAIASMLLAASPLRGAPFDDVSEHAFGHPPLNLLRPPIPLLS